MNSKSDVAAKEAFCALLRKRGYQSVKVISTPADICGRRNGKDYLFELKYTREEERYFGSATLTEWMAAIENPESFVFVVAYQRHGRWRFDEYTAEEFMAHSYVPPFKIFFNVPVGKRQVAAVPIESRRVHLTHSRLKLLMALWRKLKKTVTIE